MNTAQKLKPLASLMRPCPDATKDPAGNAGWFLERERFKRGYSLNTAREGTGIGLHYLIAIERGQLSRLPAGDQALTLIGAYGHWLGFDPGPLCSHFASLLETAPRALELPNKASTLEAPSPKLAPAPASKAKKTKPAQQHQSPRRTQQKRKKNLHITNRMIVLGSLTSIIAIFAVTGFMLINGHKPELAGQQSAYPALPSNPEITTSLPSPVAPPEILTSSTDSTENTALQGLSDLINQTIAAVDASGIGPRAEAVPLRGTMAPPNFIEQDGRRIFNPEASDARVILTAKGNVWMQLENASGQVIANLTLNAGDQYRVPNMSGLEVVAKDGGLIAASLDGKDMGTLGNPGEILVGKPLMQAFGG